MSNPNDPDMVDALLEQLSGVGQAGPRKSGEQDYDVRSTTDQDSLVLKHFRENPQDRYARRETGWKMQQNLVGPEQAENALGPAIQGKESSVEFRWRPSDHVNALVHTHPATRGNSQLTRANNHGSDADHGTVGKGGVPNYFLAPDGTVRVLERIGGKTVERVVGKLKE